MCCEPYFIALLCHGCNLCLLYFLDDFTAGLLQNEAGQPCKFQSVNTQLDLLLNAHLGAIAYPNIRLPNINVRMVNTLVFILIIMRQM